MNLSLLSQVFVGKKKVLVCQWSMASQAGFQVFVGSCVGNESLPQSITEFLFQDYDKDVESYALLPLRVDEKIIGVAALGATDSVRFETDQETTYLNRIADVLSMTVARLV